MAELIMTIEQMKDREAWLKLRNSGLGGSDAAVILGISTWKSRLALWAEKTGQKKPADLSNNKRVYWGSKLEDVVADWFCEETGKQVRRRGMMRSCEHKWMLASVDREIVGEKAGLEIKTAGVDQAKAWKEDEVPDAYYLQCQWYMAVTGYDKWYIAVLIGGNEAVWKVIERNQEQIDFLIQEGEKFWQLVTDLIPPAPDGSKSASEILAARYPNTIADSIELKGMGDVYDRLKRYEAEEETAKQRKEECKQLLMQAMGNHEAADVDGHKITWKKQAGRITIDGKGLKKDHPDIYDQYKKIGNPIRVFKAS